MRDIRLPVAVLALCFVPFYLLGRTLESADWVSSGFSPRLQQQQQQERPDEVRPAKAGMSSSSSAITLPEAVPTPAPTPWPSLMAQPGKTPHPTQPPSTKSLFSESPTTRRPTFAPTVRVEHVARECLSQGGVLPQSKRLEPYACVADGDVANAKEETSEFPWYTRTGNGSWRLEDGHQNDASRQIMKKQPPTRVYHLVDTEWGQFCNRLGMVGGAISHLRQVYAKNESLALAFGPAMSEVLWHLDLKRLSYNVPAVYMDCGECENSAEHPDMLWGGRVIRCRNVIVQGEVRDASTYVLQVVARHFPGDVFWYLGPSSVGYLPELAHELVPNERLRLAVEKAIREIRAKMAASSAGKLVGIHRRYMDGECYNYFQQGGGQIDCNYQWSEVESEFKSFLARCDKASHDDVLLNRTFQYNELRTFPLVFACNYTLDDMQVAYIRAHLPNNVFPSSPPPRAREGLPYLLLADDGQTPLGARAIRESPHIAGTFTVADGYAFKPPCLDGKSRALLADAYALALTDYHVGNPTSSCDSIISMWRHTLRRAEDSSYPQWCYREFYRERHFPGPEYWMKN